MVRKVRKSNLNRAGQARQESTAWLTPVLENPTGMPNGGGFYLIFFLSGQSPIPPNLTNLKYKLMKAQRENHAVGDLPLKRLYSIREAALYLGRSAWSVREMYYHGKLPSVRDGRRMLFDIQDLNAWIERNKRALEY